MNHDINKAIRAAQELEALARLMQDQTDFPIMSCDTNTDTPSYGVTEYHTTSPRDFDLYCYANELRDGFSTHSYVAPDNEVVFVAKMIRP